MNRRQFTRWLAAALACLNWILATPGAHAAPPAERVGLGVRETATPVVDVALHADGRLDGQVVDTTGRPRAHEAVVVQCLSGGPPQKVMTDERGAFAVRGLGGGVFEVRTDGGSAVGRFWAHATAPPAATDRMLLISDPHVERGQKPIGHALFSRPVLLGLIIAAAIAIPIAVHNLKDDDSAS